MSDAPKPGAAPHGPVPLPSHLPVLGAPAPMSEQQARALESLNARLALSAAAAAEMMVELEERNARLASQQERLDVLNRRLAAASASSAELVVELELKGEALAQMNGQLSQANALAAELVAEVHAKNEEIQGLNQALARANASASELYSELDSKRAALEEALEHVKQLQGIIPICMYCHDIRDDKESWHKLEAYIHRHSEARFSHGLCPDCLREHFPETGADATGC